MVWLKIPLLVATHRLEVSRGLLQKHPLLSPGAQLELTQRPVKNLLFFSLPQTQLCVSPFCRRRHNCWCPIPPSKANPHSPYNAYVTHAQVSAARNMETRRRHSILISVSMSLQCHTGPCAARQSVRPWIKLPQWHTCKAALSCVCVWDSGLCLCVRWITVHRWQWDGAWFRATVGFAA